MLGSHQLREGSYTSTVYNLIKDTRHAEAIDILEPQVTQNPNSRAALSLLAYCQFNVQAFDSSAENYKRLSELYPSVTDYRFQHSLALYKAGKYDDALRASFAVDDEAYIVKVKQLQASIRYTMNDLAAANSLVAEINLPAENPMILINQGCILAKEGNYKAALQKFTAVYQTSGYRAYLAYNIALCHYRLGQYASSLKAIADVIERGIKEYPELSVGMRTEGIDVRTVGNTMLLCESAFVEAFNLKAAIEHNLKNFQQAREALTDMPPRKEEELDPVTLHNNALMNMEQDPTSGFEQLQFLVSQAGDQANNDDVSPEATGAMMASSTALRPQTGMAVFSDRLSTAAAQADITITYPMHPPEALQNYILLLIKYDDLSTAGDVLTQYREWAERYISPNVMEFIEAVLLAQEAPQDAASALEKILQKQTDNLRRLFKKVTDAKNERNDEKLKVAIRNYEEGQDQYLPVLMAQAKIYWDKSDFDTVEQLFRKTVEFMSDQDSWRINVAHTMFVQGQKFSEAANFYDPIVNKYLQSGQSMLDVEAVVLANLCVCYIMTSRNDTAEELMRKIEKEEEDLAYSAPNRKLYHLCIVNLVIGTLYCSKGNYEFGLQRVIKSLEPYSKKLGPDTWYYCKRCFLSLVECLMKEMIVVSDETIRESLEFLTDMEGHGKDVEAHETPTAGADAIDPKNTVAWEARQLKSLLLSHVGWP